MAKKDEYMYVDTRARRGGDGYFVRLYRAGRAVVLVLGCLSLYLNYCQYVGKGHWERRVTVSCADAESKWNPSEAGGLSAKEQKAMLVLSVFDPVDHPEKYGK